MSNSERTISSESLAGTDILEKLEQLGDPDGSGRGARDDFEFGSARSSTSEKRENSSEIKSVGDALLVAAELSNRSSEASLSSDREKQGIMDEIIAVEISSLSSDDNNSASETSEDIIDQLVALQTEDVTDVGVATNKVVIDGVDGTTMSIEEAVDERNQSGSGSKHGLDDTRPDSAVSGDSQSSGDIVDALGELLREEEETQIGNTRQDEIIERLNNDETTSKSLGKPPGSDEESSESASDVFENLQTLGEGREHDHSNHQVEGGSAVGGIDEAEIKDEIELLQKQLNERDQRLLDEGSLVRRMTLRAERAEAGQAAMFEKLLAEEEELKRQAEKVFEEERIIQEMGKKYERVQQEKQELEDLLQQAESRANKNEEFAKRAAEEEKRLREEAVRKAKEQEEAMARVQAEKEEAIAKAKAEKEAADKLLEKQRAEQARKEEQIRDRRREAIKGRRASLALKRVEKEHEAERRKHEEEEAAERQRMRSDLAIVTEDAVREGHVIRARRRDAAKAAIERIEALKSARAAVLNEQQSSLSVGMSEQEVQGEQDSPTVRTLVACVAEGNLKHIETIYANADGLIDSDWADSLTGQTILIEAARRGNAEVVAFLVEKGVDVDKQDVLGRSALAWASQVGALDAVKCLVEAGCDLDSCDRFGQTPLFHAALSCHVDSTKMLLECGADHTKTDAAGYSPKLWAVKHGFAEIANVLSHAKHVESAIPASRTVIEDKTHSQTVDNTESTPGHIRGFAGDLHIRAVDDDGNASNNDHIQQSMTDVIREHADACGLVFGHDYLGSTAVSRWSPWRHKNDDEDATSTVRLPSNAIYFVDYLGSTVFSHHASTSDELDTASHHEAGEKPGSPLAAGVNCNDLAPVKEVTLMAPSQRFSIVPKPNFAKENDLDEDSDDDGSTGLGEIDQIHAIEQDGEQAKELPFFKSPSDDDMAEPIASNYGDLDAVSEEVAPSADVGSRGAVEVDDRGEVRRQEAEERARVREERLAKAEARGKAKAQRKARRSASRTRLDSGTSSEGQHQRQQSSSSDTGKRVDASRSTQRRRSSSATRARSNSKGRTATSNASTSSSSSIGTRSRRRSSSRNRK